jgi:hypothetical protein
VAGPPLFGVAGDQPSLVHYLAEVAALRAVDVGTLQLADVLAGVSIEILTIEVSKALTTPSPHPFHDGLSCGPNTFVKPPRYVVGLNY